MRPHKGMILAYLRRIAHLIESDIWNVDQAQKLRDQLNNTWFPTYKVYGIQWAMVLVPPLVLLLVLSLRFLETILN